MGNLACPTLVWSSQLPFQALPPVHAVSAAASAGAVSRKGKVPVSGTGHRYCCTNEALH